MASKPLNFFEKNCKWFLLVFVILFLFKSVQSCNRNMKLSIDSKQYIQMIDSLEKHINKNEKQYATIIDELKFELKLAKEKEHAAVEKAQAIQSVAEKVRSNTTTTVNVRGVEVDTTVSNKNKK